MFRSMRRFKQQLPVSDTESILLKGQTGILGVIGDEGYPYTVPVNYTYGNGKIFFHSAQAGHKIDAIRQNEKVSFCVIEKDQVIPHLFATDYRSAIVFGKARILTDLTDIRSALIVLNQKYAPDYEKEGEAEINSDLARVAIVEISIEHQTGKSASASVLAVLKAD